MKKTTSGFAMWTCVMAASLAALPAQAGVLDSLLLASEIQAMRLQVARGGQLDQQRLEIAISEGGSAGLGLARAIFTYNRAAQREGRPLLDRANNEGLDPGSALLNGLARRKDQLPEVLDLLEEEIRTPVDDNPLIDSGRIEYLRRVRAGLYVKLHGGFEPAFRKAAEELHQPGLDAIDRAMLVETFGTVSNRPNKPRELAFELYRPYLRAATGEEQAAAVSVASATWDSGALEDLRVLAYESPSPFARSVAFDLVARFLRYGSAYPPPGKNTTSRDWAEAHSKVFDPQGAIEWERGYDDWRLQLHLLAYGKPPEPVVQEPPPPSIDLREAAEPAGQAVADPRTRSFAPTDPSAGPATTPPLPAAPPLPASSTTERRPSHARDSSQEGPMRPSP